MRSFLAFCYLLMFLLPILSPQSQLGNFIRILSNQPPNQFKSMRNTLTLLDELVKLEVNRLHAWTLDYLTTR